LARVGNPSLVGASAYEQGQVDQWIDYAKSSISSRIHTIYMGVFGHTAPQEAEYNDAVKAIKEAVKVLNTQLTGKDYLVGNTLTIADVVVAVSLVLPFQTILDGGFRKAMGNTTAWMERICKLPEMVNRLGHIKFTQKALKAILAAKPVEAKKEAVKAKVEEVVEEKKVNPLDVLPPTTFDLYSFKTYFVNLTQEKKKAEGFQFFLDNYDREGYCIFYIQYEKCEGEGVLLYQTANNLNGFLQRCDHFRRHVLAMHAIVGEEPALDIEGVWLYRGKIIPQEMLDNPQFEYYKQRELSIDVEADRNLIRDYWCAKNEDVVNGRKIQDCKMHK
jgi:elongation factor 1-gamma